MDIYYFTDKFEKSEIQSLNKKIHIIYRNYSKGNHELTIKKLVKFCKNNNRKIFISNEVNLALNIILMVYIFQLSTNLYILKN